MDRKKLITKFAPPERSSAAELERQRKLFAGKDIHSALLSATPDYLVVLNKNRQIVYANEAFVNKFGNKTDGNIFGLRTGEVFNCSRAFEMPGGCGTSEFCRTCGAVNAILSSLNGNEDVQECRILINNPNEALDLRVWTKPLKVDNENFSVFTFTDISDEKRRIALERIFFHDVLNTASSLKSFVKLMDDSPDNGKQELISTASVLVDKLLEEIQFQRDLALAETNELVINPQSCNTLQLINNIIAQYKNLPLAHGKEIIIDPESINKSFICDSVLISRVLSNMLKNSLEASQKGEPIKIGSRPNEETVSFYVHNKAYMNPDVQNQVFQRSFSTKGKGRGLGTYSMKLLTEHYLKGKIYFTSSPEEGTTFFVELPLYLED